MKTNISLFGILILTCYQTQSIPLKHAALPVGLVAIGAYQAKQHPEVIAQAASATSDALIAAKQKLHDISNHAQKIYHDKVEATAQFLADPNHTCVKGERLLMHIPVVARHTCEHISKLPTNSEFKQMKHYGLTVQAYYTHLLKKEEQDLFNEIGLSAYEKTKLWAYKNKDLRWGTKAVDEYIKGKGYISEKIIYSDTKRFKRDVQSDRKRLNKIAKDYGLNPTKLKIVYDPHMSIDAGAANIGQYIVLPLDRKSISDFTLRHECGHSMNVDWVGNWIVTRHLNATRKEKCFFKQTNDKYHRYIRFYEKRADITAGFNQEACKESLGRQFPFKESILNFMGANIFVRLLRAYMGLAGYELRRDNIHPQHHEQYAYLKHLHDLLQKEKLSSKE